MNTTIRSTAAVLATATVLALGLAGCATEAPSEPASRVDVPESDLSSTSISIVIQRELARYRNLRVNDNDPRGLHGAPELRGIGTAHFTSEVMNDIDPRGLHGVTKPGRVTSIEQMEAEADSPTPAPQPRRLINDDDPRGLHGVTTNGW